MDAVSVGQIVVGTVLGMAEGGGYLLDVGAPAPASVHAYEVCLKPNSTRGRVPGQGFAKLAAGEVYEAAVTAIDGDSLNVSIAQAQRSISWRRVMQMIDEDVTYFATVLRIGSAGATVDIEGLAAFVPWSHWQLSETERASQDLCGHKLHVKFLEADQKRERLVASHRRVKVAQRADELAAGQVVDGVVTSVKPFGAVVRLDGIEGVDGLLHISQVSQVYVEKMESVFEVGEHVRCLVIKVDPKDGSISLSTKMLERRAGDVMNNRSAVFTR
eukprot:CAMPEP_0119377480 /NCGR_PEP_ID=MMETSP1334-20130426/45149_1 /TAXON_ID=127549 /ORGANISM="Calcidiscus leptoporus, Strain RCC1130" /LENGTH=271 /DNA_ID=CAMNT_0007396421 /DNA_START=176 /DNA_END=991 /DNA_ORIENTATION=-